MITHSRWLAYTTASAASAVIGANSAEATIHYSGPINRILHRNTYVTFQLDQPGDSIRLFDRTGTNYHGYDWFGADGRAGASIVGFYDSCCFAQASNVPRGQLISNNPFVPALSAILGPCGGCQFGGGLGIIGFKFNNGSGDQYGWVRIQRRPSFSEKFRLLDFAYGDVGDRIAAGQKRDEPNNLELESLGGLAVGWIDDRPVKLLDYAYGDVGDRVKVGQKPSDMPELESLGGLALGAAGLLAWRRRRSR